MLLCTFPACRSFIIHCHSFEITLARGVPVSKDVEAVDIPIRKRRNSRFLVGHIRPLRGLFPRLDYPSTWAAAPSGLARDDIAKTGARSRTRKRKKIGQNPALRKATSRTERQNAGPKPDATNATAQGKKSREGARLRAGAAKPCRRTG